MKTATKHITAAFTVIMLLMLGFNAKAQKLSPLGMSCISTAVKSKSISSFGHISMTGSFVVEKKKSETDGKNQEYEEKIPGLKISAYPNPFQSELRLKFSKKLLSENIKPSIMIFNASGKTVTAGIDNSYFEQDNEIIIQAENLKQGCYIIKVSAGKQNYSIKVIKL